MADVYFTPKLAPIAKVIKITLSGNINGADRLAVNGKTIQSPTRATDIATSTTAFFTLINGSKEPEYAEFTWTNNAGAGEITGTLKSPHKGKPIPIDTVANPAAFVATNTGTGTIAISVVTENQGPHVLAAGNLSATPVANDTLTFRKSDVDLKYDLGAFAGIGALDRLVFDASYKGRVGLQPLNRDQELLELLSDHVSYTEYRQPQFLDIDADVVDIGLAEGLSAAQLAKLPPAQLSRLSIAQQLGSKQIWLDLGTAPTKITGYFTARTDDGDAACKIKAAHASNTFTSYVGTYEIGPDRHASQVPYIAVSGVSEIRTGEKTTHGTVVVGGNGKFTCDLRTGNITRLQINGDKEEGTQGTATLFGVWDSTTGGGATNGNITEVVLLGGRLKWMGGNRIGNGASGSAMVVRQFSEFDATDCFTPFIVTKTVELHLPCTFLDPNQMGSYNGTPPFKFYGDLKDPRNKLDFGKRFDATITTQSIAP
jgi:hypothetical protein